MMYMSKNTINSLSPEELEKLTNSLLEGALCNIDKALKLTYKAKQDDVCNVQLINTYHKSITDAAENTLEYLHIIQCIKNNKMEKA